MQPMTDAGDGLSADQLETWIALIALMETLPQAIDAQLKADIGVNLFEYTVLAMLSEEADRTLPMSALAAVSFGSISRLSHTVSRLEKRGWVKKRAGVGSRRHNTVWLTDTGVEVVTSAAPRHLAEVRRLVFDNLSASDVRTLSRISMKLITAAAPEVVALLDEKLPIVIERNAGGTTD